MKTLGSNIAYYRKEKGMSQEKLAEYMGISRQAVTKWESDMSSPSTDNLIRLSQLYGVKVEDLLNTSNKVQENAEPSSHTINMGKAPTILSIISLLSVLAYFIYGSISATLDIGTLICVIVIALPIQLFVNLYMTNAVRNDDFSNIAGFDSCISYNTIEVKKLLININHHIGMISTIYILLIIFISYADIHNIDIVGLLVLFYGIEFVGTILIINHNAVDRIYCDECDIKRAKAGLSVNVSYLLLLLIGTIITILTFNFNKIENNTAPAIILSGLLLLGTAISTVAFLSESKCVRNWNCTEEKYKISKLYKISFLVTLCCFIMMLFVV